MLSDVGAQVAFLQEVRQPTTKLFKRHDKSYGFTRQLILIGTARQPPIFDT